MEEREREGEGGMERERQGGVKTVKVLVMVVGFVCNRT